MAEGLAACSLGMSAWVAWPTVSCESRSTQMKGIERPILISYYPILQSTPWRIFPLSSDSFHLYSGQHLELASTAEFARPTSFSVFSPQAFRRILGTSAWDPVPHPLIWVPSVWDPVTTRYAERSWTKPTPIQWVGRGPSLPTLSQGRSASHH